MTITLFQWGDDRLEGDRDAPYVITVASVAPRKAPSPIENGVKPSAGSGAVASAAASAETAETQPRDFRWADDTETDIKSALKHVPNLSQNAGLNVRCGTTLCVATGQIAVGASPSKRGATSRYLQTMQFAEALGTANALTDNVELDAATGTFRIGFSRVRR